MAFPVSRATAHLEAVAEAHNITVWWRRGIEGSEANQPLRIASIPRPRNGLLYLVALHELGHILCRDAESQYDAWDEDPDDIEGEVTYEGAAWAWAAEHRDEGIRILDREWRRAGTLFASYLKGGNLRPEPQSAGRPVPHEGRHPETVSSP